MSEGRLFRSLTVWKHALLPVAVTMAVTLFLFSFLEAAKTTTRLPPQVKFIPVESQALAVSSSLDGIWRNLSNHIARLVDPAPNSFWADMNGTLYELSARCIAVQTAEDLSNAGLDTARGLSFALIDGGQDFLLSLPVHDEDRALELFGKLFMDPVPITLTPPDADATAEQMVVTADRLENARLCEVPSGAPFQGDPRPIEPGADHEIMLSVEQEELTLYLVPDGAGPMRLELSCRAYFEGGASQPCDCRIDYGSSCDQSFVQDSGTQPLTRWDSEPGDMAMWTSENEDLFVGFVDRYMLIAAGPERIQSAVGRRDERATRLLGDNALLGLVEQFHTEAEAADATLLGLFRGIEEPVMGSVPFSISAGPDRIRLRSALPIDTFGFEVFENLISDTAAPAPNLTNGAPFAGLFNDPSIGNYLTLLDEIYGKSKRRLADELHSDASFAEPVEVVIVDPVVTELPKVSDEDTDGRLVNGNALTSCASIGQENKDPSIYDMLGNFAPLARGIMTLDSVGPLEAYLLDVRDGVPEVVLVQHGLVPWRMEDLINRTRKQMKEARDIEVLCNARAAYWKERGENALPSFTNDFIEFLGGEGPELVDYYMIQDDVILPDPDAQPFEFDTDAYRDSLGRFDIGYIPPPVSDLDLRFRFDARDRAELDIEALQNNAFRLAYGRLADGSVAFAMDAATLDRFLGILASPADDPDRMAENKLWFEGNPEDLVTLGLLYPVEEVRSLFATGGFEVLDQYRSMRLSVLPGESFRGLLLDAELVHD
ncbi:hypothetical protein [uncultured Ruegeria sp.]|uniref:hypothetical protein n=1 Tax=uncultured Ruegeria sp. TaxID=259304 RepID=UPI00262544F2|nr:hypothetical protein [uncultured Ruegeria sp.]